MEVEVKRVLRLEQLNPTGPESCPAYKKGDGSRPSPSKKS